MKLLALSLIAISLLFTQGCATNPVTGKQDFVLMSEDQEINLGKQAHQQILQQYSVYDDPELQKYVSDLVEEIATMSHRSNLIFHATVLDSPEVNAFALPGGYVYITRGIMSYLNSEAELAGVLGHEVGHVTARHGVRQQSASTVTGVLAAVLATAAGVQGAGDAANIAGTALIRGYGRQHELEADRLGAEYLARLGYDPQEMIEVVGVLKSQEEFDRKLAAEEGREPRAYHGLFSTHPKNDTRLQEVIAAADKYRAEVQRPANREKYLSYMNDLPVGSSAAQGVVRGNQFYHRDLDVTITFPEGWKIDNLPDRLIASSKSQDGVIQIMLDDLNKRETPKQYLENRFDKDLRASAPIETENFSGHTGITKLKGPFGNADTRVAVVFRDRRVYQIFAAGKDANLFKRYDPLFVETARSIRKLKNSELALTEPKRLKIVTAKKGDTFESLAKQSNIEHHAADQLRLLNGMFPDGQPEPGQKIKIVK